MLKITLVGINYAPELAGIGPYTTGLANHYASRGHKVHVITGTPHYPEWHRITVPSDEPSLNPTVHRYRHHVPRRPHVSGRIGYEITWLASASRGIPFAAGGVVIGVVPSLSGGVVAWLASRKLGVPFGLLFHDVLGMAARQSGYAGGTFVGSPTRAIEGFLGRRAAAVAIVAEGFRSYFESLGVDSSRILRVRNWDRTSHAAGMDELSRLSARRQLEWSDADFVCLHAGNMGQKQALENVLKAASLLRRESIRFVFCGSGNDELRLRKLATSMGLENVTFLGVQEQCRYQAMLESADILLLNQRSSVADMALPSKLTSYFGVGRPVVAAVSEGSEAAREIRASGGGVVVPPDDSQALADQILILKNEATLRAALAARGRAYSVACLLPSAALETYDDFLERLLGNAHRILSGGFVASATASISDESSNG